MSRHTAGRWRVADLSGKYYGTDVVSDYGIVVERLGCVADCVTPSERSGWNNGDSHYEKAETLANARLIAAAPELLEAARLAVLNFKRSNVSGAWMGDDDHEAWGALDAAIAKAEGR